MAGFDAILTEETSRKRAERIVNRRLERNSQREIKPVPGVGEKMVSLIQGDCPFVGGIDLKIKRAPAQFFGRADDVILSNESNLELGHNYRIDLRWWRVGSSGFYSGLTQRRAETG